MNSENKKQLIQHRWIRGLASETAQKIYKSQVDTLDINSLNKTGDIRKYISSNPSSVASSDSLTKLTLRYPIGIRFLDLKKSSKGNTKVNYTPIYNKIVWGYIYSHLYNQLRFGISQDLNKKIEQRLINAGYTL